MLIYKQGWKRNITESNTETPECKEGDIPVIQNITTTLEITSNQRKSLTYLIDNVDKIKAILDGSNEYYRK